MMVGEETDKMFQKKNCKARVAYLNGSENIETPPVELIQFVDSKIHKEQSDLFTTSISEVCFYTGKDMADRAGVDFIAAGWTHTVPHIIETMQRICPHYCRTVAELAALLLNETEA